VTTLDESDRNILAKGMRGDTGLVGPVALKTILIFGAVQAVLAVLHIAVAWQDDGALPGRLTRFFHLDREGNLPTWFAATQFLCLAAAFFRLYLRDRRGPGSRSHWLWGICAAGAVLLSLDEGAALHELLGTLLGLAFARAPAGTWLNDLEAFPSYYWILIYVPIALPLAVVLVVSAARRIGTNRYLLVAGAFSYVSGALVLDFLEGRYGTTDHTGVPIVLNGVPYLLDIFLIEEMLEMFGVTLVLSAIVQQAASLARHAGKRAR
jgi:uncharacterized membrane protein